MNNPKLTNWLLGIASALLIGAVIGAFEARSELSTVVALGEQMSKRLDQLESRLHDVEMRTAAALGQRR